MSGAAYSGLIAARPHLSKSVVSVNGLVEIVRQLPTSNLWPPLSDVVLLVQRYAPVVPELLRMGAEAPALLGEEGPVHYLVLAQNSDEIRATGGFITGLGVVRTMSRT